MDGDSLPVHLAGGGLLFVVAVAVGSALFFGLISSLGATAVETAPARQSATRLRAGMRKTLVAGQVALPVVLVATAGLLARSLAGLRSLDLGFHNYGVLTFYIYAPRTYQAEDYQRLYDRFFTRVSALPGVDSVSAGFPGPYQGGSYSGTIFVPGAETKSREHEIARQSVYERYFETIGARPVRGRDFDADDFVHTAKTAIVNQAFAREFFGAEDPVGKMISFNDSGPADVTIVGMVRDMQHDGIRTTAQPVVYVPAARDENRSASVILVNARLRSGDLTRIIRRELAAIDPSVAMEDSRTLRERIDRSIFQDRMLAGLSVRCSSRARGRAANAQSLVWRPPRRPVYGGPRCCCTHRSGRNRCRSTGQASYRGPDPGPQSGMKETENRRPFPSDLVDFKLLISKRVYSTDLWHRTHKPATNLIVAILIEPYGRVTSIQRQKSNLLMMPSAIL
jgi:hypothetical protein